MKIIQNNLKKIIYAIKRIYPYKKEIYDYEIYLDSSETKPFKKKALVSYLTGSVLNPNKRIRFSNDGIALSIPRALNELGYSVDIIDWNNMKYIPKIKYDLFFGHVGKNYKNIYNNLNKDAVMICFSPGDYWKFANLQEKNRFLNLEKRHDETIPFERYRFDYELEEFSYKVADGIICLGDESVLEPYSKFPLVLNLNNASFQDNHYDKTDKNFENINNNFLFFAGGGNVHKGLDLLLDVFVESDKHIYICTVLEPEFKNVFKNELKRHNIHYMGWVKQRSKKFYQIMDNCAFIIFPSCSEGSAGSVVECMNQGLIPIVSRETRIDVTDYGIFLNECTVEEISEIVDDLSNKPISWIKEKSELTRKAALIDFSEKKFLENMKNNIVKIIEKSKKNL